ncbi:HAD-like domain-containing protein [Dichotomocladium elegans]|nr:HAD-like domain-containing protein [Dichotomocladium elegans]
MPAVAFDFLGTLFSFDKVIDLFVDVFGPEFSTRQSAQCFFYDWFWAGLRDYVAASHSGRYCPLATALKSTLIRACLVHGLTLLPAADQIDQIMAAFGELEPAPSALEALGLLKENNWDIWIVTNASYEATVAMLEKNAITDYFRLQVNARTMSYPSVELNILSCDDLGVSKPHPKNFYLISSHAWDLAGAKNVSFRTVFLTSEEKVYPKQIYDDIGPDVQGDTILECVKAMIDLESKKRHFL